MVAAAVVVVVTVAAAGGGGGGGGGGGEGTSCFGVDKGVKVFSIDGHAKGSGKGAGEFGSSDCSKI